MATSMTGAAWERGFKNALICVAGGVVAWATATALIATVYGRGLGDSALHSYVLLFGAVIITFYASWIRQIFSRGPVLLDCGPRPCRFIFVVNLLLFLAIGLGSFGSVNSPFDIRGPIGPLMFAAFWASMIPGRLQLRENGVWLYCGLLRWEKVASYEWVEGSTCTLLLRSKSVLPFMGRGALPVPSEYKVAIDELLRERCPDPERA